MSTKINWSEIAWSQENYKKFQKHLESLGEEKYAAFAMKMIPGATKIHGIRSPIMDKLAKEISSGDWRSYIKMKKDDIYEEIALEGVVINYAKDRNYAETLKLIDYFVPKINNWAFNDSFASKDLVKKYRKEFWAELDRFLKNPNPWTQRFGLIMILSNYVDEDHIDKIFPKLKSFHSEHYYVQMGLAWLIAELYTKFPKETFRFLKDADLQLTVMRKAAQKIRDSRRVSQENKDRVTALVKTLK
ncbi:MAG: DNA alkylation repair protein [Pseudomonadales bacterium]|jgi:3-methyladenine DNA glycosylase AlkD|nr:DNA alkylation repair protein [Pseudomonadales bacterium]